LRRDKCLSYRKSSPEKKEKTLLLPPKENHPPSSGMKNPLSDKIILITGASGGIGEAAARAFDREGACVILASRNQAKLESIACEMKLAGVYAIDMMDEAAVKEMILKVIEKYSRIDILINNAASIIVSPVETVTSEDMLKAMRTNLIGPMVAVQTLMPFMKKLGGGHIINIGSPGYMMGIPYYAPYVCSKAAVSAWTRTMQAEWAGSEIMVSEYFPGYIKTDSKPESRVGEVAQDLLMEEKQNFLTRTFAKPKTPEDVARQLIKLALKPRILAYSGSGVRIGAFISNFAGFRLGIAKQMAETARTKMNGS